MSRKEYSEAVLHLYLGLIKPIAMPRTFALFLFQVYKATGEEFLKIAGGEEKL